MNRFLKWFRQLFSEPVPSYSETFNTEPSITFKGEVIPRSESEGKPTGMTETYSEPGIIFRVGDQQLPGTQSNSDEGRKDS